MPLFSRFLDACVAGGGDRKSKASIFWSFCLHTRTLHSCLKGKCIFGADVDLKFIHTDEHVKIWPLQQILTVPMHLKRNKNAQKSILAW